MKFDEITNLALLRTENKSSRSGVGWALLDAQSNFLSADAVVAGSSPERPIFSIKKHIDKVDHLYLTTEPFEGVFNVSKLTQLLESSNLTKITLGVPLPNSMVLNQWRSWLDKWSGTVIYDAPNPVAERVTKGLSKFLQMGMPWITCVSAAGLTGSTIALDSLELEFGFRSYISNLLTGSRAVLYTKEQQPFLTHAELVNSADEELYAYEVSSHEHFAPLLRHCANTACFHVIILCDMDSLSHLINLKLVDEIVHHICHEQPTENLDIPNDIDVSKTTLNLADWKLLNSEVVGNCNRIVLSREVPTPLLGGRLN